MNKHLNVAVEGDDGGLVICRGCKARGTYAALPSGECPTPYKPNSVLLKESLAREQALQQRLTAADERADVLVTALSKIKLRLDAFVEAERDMPSPSVEVCQSIAYAALKPADAEPYQGIPGTSFQRLNMLANQGE